MSKINRERISVLLERAIRNLGGSGHIVQISKELWSLLKKDGMTDSDDVFYTWQYDMRWASQNLRNQGKLEKSNVSKLPKGVWRLV